MAVYSFSTKSSRPSDEEAVEELKKLCDTRRLNFSAVVVDLIKAHIKESRNGQS
ncbi:hypothetical protein [Dickeya phage Amaethon]|nr:hypothetical protein [Dickeya phage Amaethon]